MIKIKVLMIFTLIAIGCIPVSLCSVMNDFKDLLELIPVEQIKAIASDHLQNDAEFGDAVRYLQGSDWADLVATTNANPESVDFKKHMKTAGLDLDLISSILNAYIKTLHPGISPGHEKNLRSFLDAVEKIIPEDKLQILVKDKMENSKDFQKFYKQISSEESKKLFEEMRAQPDVQKIFNTLTNMGVKVQEFLKDIYEFLGWGKP